MEGIRRLLPIARVAWCLAIVILALNGVMLAVDRVAPNWLPARMQGSGFDEDIKQRVLAAERLYPAQADQGKYLCVFFGLSSMREGSDLQSITQQTGGDCRILGLCAAGPSLEDIYNYSGSLRASKLRPDLVIIGINEFHQAKPTAQEVSVLNRERVTLTSAILHHDLRNVTKLLLGDIWFYARRQDVSLEMEAILLNAKAKILDAMGAHIENGATDPWREMIRLETPTKASEAAFQEQLTAYAARDLFKPETYTSTIADQQRALLIDLIRTLQSRGSTVVIVLMPEHSKLRARLPVNAVEGLLSSLTQAFGASEPAVVNLRDAIGDEDFTDISHVNSDGRSALSNLLAKVIEQYLPTHRPPLMAASSATRP